MTKTEYAEYVQRVDDFFKREGINCLSSGGNEPFSSAQSCQCCGDSLYGDRYHCTAYHPETNEILEYESICTDCVYFVEHGQLDDMTMLDIKE